MKGIVIHLKKENLSEIKKSFQKKFDNFFNYIIDKKISKMNC